ncbi:S8 family serine peptidase [Flavobacterium sp.]|jgi:subtilisin family serine protease|uniref:S8 family serine peptidase n=1 Tax=Flavobacterium sp. TaxID=239 RepID=UPI0037BF0054
MKKKVSLLIFMSLFSLISFGQDLNFFLVEMSNKEFAPKFKKENNFIVYDGKDEREFNFFKNYNILDFFQAFPDSKREKTLNVFMFVTKEKFFGENLVTTFSDKFIKFEDVTDFKVELSSSYPNDYGISSPQTNLGFPLSLSNFDYVNVPKAWDYTYGDSSIKVGISDAIIDVRDADFSSKTTLLPGYFDSQNYSPPYSLNNIETWHGTSVASIAAAQGNNSYGLVGVCSDCSILATWYLYGTPGTYTNPTPNLNRLLQLAYNGAKVINMSWTTFSTSPPNTYSIYQWIFDEIYDENVVCIASAGNNNSSPGLLYGYPASYNHVISVLSVNHKNEWSQEVVNDPNYGEISLFVKDMISPSVVTNYNGNGPYAFNSWHTVNESVDICAPGYNSVIYPWYLLGNTQNGQPLYYGSGTSGAAPHVTGTVGLMYSLNDCLLVDEVEDIIQLTSKNLESINGNQNFIGYSGSGKLEVGDAVEFTYESMIPNGNAVIDNQDFLRFNFDLSRISNNLTLSNLILRESNTSTFKAKNSIDIIENSDFKPTTGFIDINIDTSMDICSSSQRVSKSKSKKEENNYDLIQRNLDKKVQLFPNPNEGDFRLVFNDKILEEIEVNIFDVFGKLVYSMSSKESQIDFKLNNLNSGVYFVKISSSEMNESIKFIKK